MTAEEVDLEVSRSIQKLCRALRSNRARPELAIPAAQWETKVNEHIAEIEKLQTPALPKQQREAVAA